MTSWEKLLESAIDELKKGMSETKHESRVVVYKDMIDKSEKLMRYFDECYDRF